MPKNHEVLIDHGMIHDYGSLNAVKIQQYLIAIDSWLKNKVCVVNKESIPEWLLKKAEEFKDATAREIFIGMKDVPFNIFIDALCREYNIEPIWILSLIQKEQSALFKSQAPTKFVQDKIVGYGNTENKSVPDKYVGFETELFASIRQWRKYDGFLEVQKYETHNIRLYDSNDMLARFGYERYIVASNASEGKAFLYNPRIEGIANHAAIYARIFDKCKELKLLIDKYPY